MKNPISQLNFFFFSTLMAILIWMASPSVKGNVKDEIPFPFTAFEARYNINWLGLYRGESVHKLQRSKYGNYHFETRTEPRLRFLPFHCVESSDFIWQSGKILPQRYYYNIQEGKRHKRGNVIFDWKNNLIKNTHIHPPWETAIPLDVQDKLTQTLSLRQALMAGKSKLTYLVAEQDKLKTYSFTILGKEQLQTKLGLLETIKLEHISRKGHRTVMWFAKKFDYLPVKMIQLRQGKQVVTGEILSFSSL